MPNRFFTQFRAVDFFGKSIPGTVAAIFILSITPFPSEFIESVGPAKVTLRGVTTLLILVIGVVIISFVIGQVLDTIGLVAERILYGIGHAIWRVCSSISFVPSKSWYTRIRELTEEEENNLPTQKKIWLEFLDWIYNRFESARQIFKPHRSIFKHRIINYRRGEEDEPVTLFLNSIQSHSNVDPDRAEPSTLYTHSLSILDRSAFNRANRLQINFIFCRSIWVTLFIFSFIWVGLSLETSIIVILGIGEDGLLQGIPLILSMDALNVSDVRYLSVLLIILSAIFMYSSLEYKRLFLEYILSDYPQAIREHSHNSLSTFDRGIE